MTQFGWKALYPAPTRFVPGRVTSPEYLDDPKTPAEDRQGSYRDLEVLGRLPWQFAPLWNAVKGLLSKRAARGAWRLLEVGSGTGHTADRIERAARRSGIDLAVLRTDRDPPATSVTKLDWLRDPLPPVDVGYANLIIHHFRREDAVTGLRKLNEASSIGGVVYDLNRRALAFNVLRMALPFFVSSPVTVADALISVQQSFTPHELLEMAREAGIEKPRVTTHGLIRNLLAWEKS